MGSSLERMLGRTPPIPETDLAKYLAEQRAKGIIGGLAKTPEEVGANVPRLALETLAPAIPLGSRRFFGRMGFQGRTFSELPGNIQTELARAQPAVDKLGDKFDYERLAEIAEEGKNKIPVDTYFKMASVAALGRARQAAKIGRQDIEAAKVVTRAALRQVTFGLVPKIPEKELEGMELGPQGVALAETVGSIVGLGLSGKLVVGALSKTTLLPKIGPVLEELPQRVKEIMLGAGTGAVLDAARPDGLPEEPAAIDITARLASPVARALGGSETAQRVALGVAGGAFGGAIGEVIAPVFRVMRNARETRLANSIDPALMGIIKERLNAAGIGVATGEDNKAVVAKLIRNLDKVSQTERMAVISAADETRMGFVLNQLYSDPGFIGPPKLPKSKAVDAQGNLLRVYRGIRGEDEGSARFFAESPEHADLFAREPVGTGYAEGARIVPAYLDVQNPLDLTKPMSSDQAYKVMDIILPKRIGKSLIADMHASLVRGDAVIGAWGKNLALGAAKLRKAGYDSVKFLDDVKSGTKVAWLTLDESQVIPAFVSHDAQYLAGVFRANPGGLSIVKRVNNVRVGEEVVKRMGLNILSVRAGDDLIILRPKVVFPERPVMAVKTNRQLKDFTEQVRALGEGRPSTRLTIRGDGTVIRGNYSAGEMVGRYKIKPALVEGVAQNEATLREHFGLMDVQVGTGGVVEVNLPSTVTSRQSIALGRIVDKGIPQITLNSAIPGKSITLDQPFGMQVEDALAKLVKGAQKPRITADITAKVEQYRKQGVFAGQAGILPDGYPVEIVRKTEKLVYYKDPITGASHRTPIENITILPTSLEGELLPSRQVFEALEPMERTAFARLRRALNEGLAQPITTIRELEAFASTRGKLVSPLAKGKVRVYDQVTSESKVYDNMKAALAGVRNSLGPLPDLTPPEIEDLLGFKPNLGSIGNNGPPANYGESIPITEAEFVKAVETNTLGKLPPGAVAQFYLPTKSLMTVLTRKYGLPFDKVFENLQSSTVHRQNFVTAWVHGEGPGLPEGIMPLTKIYKLAGEPNEGRQRIFTAWLESESDEAARKVIEAGMKPQEIKAAKEFRKWYGLGPNEGLFKTLGIEQEFLTDYAPHLREHAEGGGNDITQVWRLSKGTSLPKSVEFFADYARDGSLNIYEDRAFIAAAKYAEAGARSRYLNGAMNDAKRLLRAVPDVSVKAPLVNYIEALRGSEFTAQRAAMDASFSNLLHSLGANEKLAKNIGERLTLGLLGLSYQSTMAFRPGLAFRNAAQIFQTTWPLMGRFDDLFTEAIGRAMTKVGRDEAIRAGAITVKQHAIFGGEDITAAMPEWLRGMNELGFKLYDTADNFTRATSFQVAKLRSNRAIEEFGKALTAGRNVAEAQRALIKDSGAMVLSKDFTNEYLRRITISPESAGDFLGKQISDITQFLYGRGNQPRWMRSVPGRFLGQFGTWPLWYIDFVRRSVRNMWTGGYKLEAMKFLGKIALVDAAIYEGGRRVGLDLHRWMSGNALFGVPPLGQPPAINVIYGMAQLSKGLSESVLGTYDSPANKQRLAEARRILGQAGLAFVPNMYAARDIGRLLTASSPTERAAVLLATRPSTDFTVQQRLDMLFAPGRLSTDIDLEQMGDNTKTATELLLKGMQMETPKLAVPPGNLPSQPYTQPQSAPQARPIKPVRPAGVQGRPPMEPTALPESIRTGESKPVL